jgi:hypothetical protein
MAPAGAERTLARLVRYHRLSVHEAFLLCRLLARLPQLPLMRFCNDAEVLQRTRKLRACASRRVA